MKKNSLYIPINFNEKLILLSDITFYDSQAQPTKFRYQLNSIPDKILLDKISIIHDTYPDFSFWWLETHEAGIKLSELKEIQKLIYIFRKLNLENKFKIVDNNLGISDYKPKYEKLRVGVPGMIGFTSDMGFDITERIFKKKFICLNRIPKPHRRDIFKFLKNNYYKDSYLSFAPNHLYDTDRMVLDEVEKISHGNMLHAWPSEYQKYSFCNIVTESIWWSGPIHITEKIDKCFSAGQPFILVAGAGYLEKLKELGFKTFSEFWDESYDNEQNYVKRMNMVKDVIHSISKLSINECQKIYKQMIPILNINKKLAKNMKSDIYMNYRWKDYRTILLDKKSNI